MRRAGKIALWVVGVLVALPVLAVIGVLIFANTGAGQRFIETQAGSLTGGMVKISGLSGRVPDDLHIAHLEITDRDGVWATADDLALDWSPTALLGLHARVNNLSAAQITVSRLPLPSAAPASPASAPFKLPVSVDVRRLAIARLSLGAPVAGVAAALKIDGAAQVPYSWAGNATIDAVRLDSPGAYRVRASLTTQAIAADITMQEPQGGLIAALAKLPALGPLAVKIDVGGPQSAERAVVTATAGRLHLNIAGTVDIPGQAAALDVDAGAPAMRPRADIAWQGIGITAHVKGKFTAPDATAAIVLTGLEAGGGKIDSIHADLTGTRGRVDLHGVMTGTHLPGAQAQLFASAPIDITAGADLELPGRPAQFRVSHPLLSLQGAAKTAGDITAQATLNVPDIAPLAATAGQDLHGSLNTNIHAAQHNGVTDLSADGLADLTGGQAPAPALLGPAKFNAVATLQGSDVTVKTVTLNGRAVRLDLSGALHDKALDFNTTLGLPNLEALSPQARGAVTGKIHIGGKIGAIAVDAAVTGEAGSGQFAKSPVNITLRATNVPAAPNADLRAQLQFSGAPVTVLAQVTTGADGTLHTVLQRADWKSLSAKADLSLAKGADTPVGRFDLTIARLGDFSALAHTDLAGSLKAVLNSAPDMATVDVQGVNLANGARRIAALSLTGRAAGNLQDPDLSAALKLDGIAAQGATGQARVTLHGREAALDIGATAQLQNLQGSNADLALSALLNGKAKQVILRSVTGNWHALALRQHGPALIDFGEKIAVDHLHLTINQAVLNVAGRVSPTLDVVASLQHLTPDIAKPFAPTLSAAGVVAADARLTGTMAAPQGRVHLTASGLRMLNGPGASLPAASVNAVADLAGRAAQINMHVNAGRRLTLAVTGAAPLQPNGALALHTTGQLDLALLAPILEAGGRRANGELSLNITANGTPLAPAVTGAITLANGELQDFTQGVQLTKMTARIDAVGDTLNITHFQATAGHGDIALNGSVGAFAPGLPVDLHLTAHDARPLSSDLLTATLDADINVRGQATAALDASGKILLHKVEINIPQGLPPSVAVLNVHRAGYKPPPPSAAPPPPASIVRLNILVDAPSSIFVRGHGLDAEMAGKLTVAGTSAAPQIEGGFELRRGDFSLAGTTLTFTKGEVSFNGASSTGKIDPTLDFEADNQTSTILAMLKISGYADAPKITLSSVPDLPQDEVLSQLLFGQSMKQLSPFQIAEIGAALAELSGLTGGGGGPLASLRKGLGLDRLSVGGGSNGSGPSVEAGRYVAKGVYVGAKQSTGGAGGTQALVQIDLTRRLKLNTTLGTGGGSVQGATPQNDPGSSVGLSYTFEY